MCAARVYNLLHNHAQVYFLLVEHLTTRDGQYRVLLYRGTFFSTGIVVSLCVAWFVLLAKCVMSSDWLVIKGAEHYGATLSLLICEHVIVLS